MKAISQQAKKVMDLLTANWDRVGNGRKIDNTEGFMPVHVELIRECNLGQIYSVAHYYKQNGDLMRDPDMEFIKGGDGEYYPISFWQDSTPKRDEAVEWEDGEITRINPELQAEMVTFANMWMKNIKVQQGL
jgi:hypothetical protein